MTKLAKDLKSSTDGMTPEQIKEWWIQAHKKLAADREFGEIYARWERQHGWKDKRRGVCKVCGSVVRPDQHFVFMGEPRMGGPSRGRHELRGFYCTSTDCGIMYKTCPPPITEVYDVPPPVRDDKEQNT
jgi:hypothetical protein